MREQERSELALSNETLAERLDELADTVFDRSPPAESLGLSGVRAAVVLSQADTDILYEAAYRIRNADKDKKALEKVLRRKEHLIVSVSEQARTRRSFDDDWVRIRFIARRMHVPPMTVVSYIRQKKLVRAYLATTSDE